MSLARVRKVQVDLSASTTWHPLLDGEYLFGTSAFGALIAPRKAGFRVWVGRNLWWRQPDDIIADATFDTLEEAKNFGVLIYTQHKPEVVDRTQVKGYPV